ncbi:hypothetical protein EGR_10602 [Echinococcus granulosus]|uniref:Uncharacterized protein n=1 Tax=Echinococcus granulosus TaxID=6210 RepID=W6UM18_ECHGR|nr:hypothetical protein EGR_10602 [Echinococcus granulosus]EUB54534.1 hypothetical protein EGR_10602 [Echinococcus granulosus]
MSYLNIFATLVAVCFLYCFQEYPNKLKLLADHWVSQFKFKHPASRALFHYHNLGQNLAHFGYFRAKKWHCKEKKSSSASDLSSKNELDLQSKRRESVKRYTSLKMDDLPKGTSRDGGVSRYQQIENRDTFYNGATNAETTVHFTKS